MEKINLQDLEEHWGKKHPEKEWLKFICAKFGYDVIIEWLRKESLDNPVIIKKEVKQSGNMIEDINNLTGKKETKNNDQGNYFS